MRVSGRYILDAVHFVSEVGRTIPRQIEVPTPLQMTTFYWLCIANPGDEVPKPISLSALIDPKDSALELLQPLDLKRSQNTR